LLDGCYYCNQFSAVDPEYQGRPARYAIDTSTPRCALHWRFICACCARPAHFMATAYCQVNQSYFCANCATASTTEAAEFGSWRYHFSYRSPWSGRWEPSLDKLEYDGRHPARAAADQATPFPGLAGEETLPRSEPTQRPANEPVGLDDVAEMWDANAAEWDACLGVDGDDTRRYWSDDVVLSMLGSPAGCQILDLGCGNGYLTRILAARGAEVVGVDMSAAMLSRAASYSATGGSIRYVRSSITDLSELPSHHFDGAVSNYVLHDVADYDRALAEVNRVLRPGAALVLTLTHPCFSSGPRTWNTNPPDSPRREDSAAFLVDDYFQRSTYLIEDWSGFSAIPYYHRPLRDYWRAFERQGFDVVGFDEPTINERGRSELSPVRAEQDERVALCCVFKIRKRLG
jgi:ubiquinone/menaquinone biosynthesis C-methylase UbiE